MTNVELRYAQIQKEALATVRACEKFQDYILGKKFLIETDHKPLVPLLNTEPLDSRLPRVLRFLLRLARFNYIVEHLPGKLLYTADVLSRAPTTRAQGNQALTQEAELWIDTIVQSCQPHNSSSKSTIQPKRKIQFALSL